MTYQKVWDVLHTKDGVIRSMDIVFYFTYKCNGCNQPSSTLNPAKFHRKVPDDGMGS